LSRASEPMQVVPVQTEGCSAPARGREPRQRRSPICPDEVDDLSFALFCGSMTINLQPAQEIERMRIAGQLAGEVLDFVAPRVKPGVTTGELDRLCHDLIVEEQKAIPAPLNYAP